MWEDCGKASFFFWLFGAAWQSIQFVPVVTKLMSEEERAICRRLQELRKLLRLSQVDFARAFGTSRDQLASVEYGRNPLRYWQADRICEKLDVCQQWLATGLIPIKGYVRLPSEIGLEIAPKELFSAAWHRRIGHRVKREVAASEAMLEIVKNNPDAPQKIFENRLYYLKLIAEAKIPPELYNEFFNALNATTSEFIRLHCNRAKPGNDDRSGKGGQYISKKELTDAASLIHVDDVKPQLPSLLERLQKATQDSGRKSELAKFLNVPLASVSRWLSGDREPGGEITLKLLKWVEQQERK